MGELRIGTLEIELLCEDPAQQSRLLEQIQARARTDLFLALDQQLARLLPDCHLVIDHLDLDLGCVKEEQFQECLGKEMVKALEPHLMARLHGFVPQQPSTSLWKVLARCVALERIGDLIGSAGIQALVSQSDDPTLCRIALLLDYLESPQQAPSMDPAKKRIESLILEVALGLRSRDHAWLQDMEAALGQPWAQLEGVIETMRALVGNHRQASRRKSMGRSRSGLLERSLVAADLQSLEGLLPLDKQDRPSLTKVRDRMRKDRRMLRRLEMLPVDLLKSILALLDGPLADDVLVLSSSDVIAHLLGNASPASSHAQGRPSDPVLAVGHIAQGDDRLLIHEQKGKTDPGALHKVTQEVVPEQLEMKPHHMAGSSLLAEAIQACPDPDAGRDAHESSRSSRLMDALVAGETARIKGLLPITDRDHPVMSVLRARLGLDARLRHRLEMLPQHLKQEIPFLVDAPGSGALGQTLSSDEHIKAFGHRLESHEQEGGLIHQSLSRDRIETLLDEPVLVVQGAAGDGEMTTGEAFQSPSDQGDAVVSGLAANRQVNVHPQQARLEDGAVLDRLEPGQRRSGIGNKRDALPQGSFVAPSFCQTVTSLQGTDCPSLPDRDVAVAKPAMRGFGSSGDDTDQTGPWLVESATDLGKRQDHRALSRSQDSDVMPDFSSEQPHPQALACSLGHRAEWIERAWDAADLQRLAGLMPFLPQDVEALKSAIEKGAGGLRPRLAPQLWGTIQTLFEDAGIATFLGSLGIETHPDKTDDVDDLELACLSGQGEGARSDASQRGEESDSTPKTGPGFLTGSKSSSTAEVTRRSSLAPVMNDPSDRGDDGKMPSQGMAGTNPQAAGHGEACCAGGISRSQDTSQRLGAQADALSPTHAQERSHLRRTDLLEAALLNGDAARIKALIPFEPEDEPAIVSVLLRAQADQRLRRRLEELPVQVLAQIHGWFEGFSQSQSAQDLSCPPTIEDLLALIGKQPPPRRSHARQQEIMQPNTDQAMLNMPGLARSQDIHHGERLMDWNPSESECSAQVAPGDAMDDPQGILDPAADDAARRFEDKTPVHSSHDPDSQARHEEVIVSDPLTDLLKCLELDPAGADLLETRRLLQVVLLDSDKARRLLLVLAVSHRHALSLASCADAKEWSELLRLRHGPCFTQLEACADRVEDALVLALSCDVADSLEPALRVCLLQWPPISGTPPVLRTCTDLLALLGRESGAFCVDLVRPFLERRLAREMPAPFLEEAWQKAKNLVKDVQDRIAVDDAGIVLVAPYLPRLFGMLELTDVDGFVDLEARLMAGRVMLFLVHGTVPPRESALCRLLLDIPDGVLIGPGELPSHFQETCTQMLEAVISHWSALGNTSVEGLRETFLQRTGWIEAKGEGWLLRVERRAFDVLLERLPWGYTTVNFSWLERALQVEWK